MPHCHWVVLADMGAPRLSLNWSQDLPVPEEVLRSSRPHRKRLRPQSPVVDLRMRRVLRPSGDPPTLYLSGRSDSGAEVALRLNLTWVVLWLANSGAGVALRLILTWGVL